MTPFVPALLKVRAKLVHFRKLQERRVELFEQIRRDYAAGEPIKKLAKKYDVHQRMVRQAIASAIPPDRRSVSFRWGCVTAAESSW